MLLQRLEQNQPDLIDEMIQGVEADYAAILKSSQENEQISVTIQEALKILRQAKTI